MFSIYLVEEGPSKAADETLEDLGELEVFLDRWKALECEKPSGLIPLIVWHQSVTKAVPFGINTWLPWVCTWPLFCGI